MTTRRLAAALILLAAAVAFADPPPEKPPKPDPISNYEARQLQGFGVMLSKSVADHGPALKCLDERLAELTRVVPPAHLSLLRDVRFWIEPGPARKPTPYSDGDAAAFYDPISDHSLPKSAYAAMGLLPDKEGGVVIFAGVGLLEPRAGWANRCMPGWLLHEAAHALQDRLVGFHHPGTMMAYRRAMDSKLYDAVATRILDETGELTTERGPAYARANCLEYFAELSAAYLNLSCGYYPFGRDELKYHDPAGYALMEKFWRSIPSTVVNEFDFPVSVDRVAENGRRFRLFDLLPGKEKAFDAWEGMTLVATDQLDGTEYRFAAADGNRWRLRPAGGTR
ncbi:MAG TPA: hypothetical protein VGF55_22350 [Gemmataceae bacterium]|jgi:hypothetical protein